MRLGRRRQPDPVAVRVPTVPVSPDVIVAPKPRRRTAAELANDAIVAEQLANQEREKELERVRRRLAAEWEAGRPREGWAMDYSRFTY
jgi:hypothetical protein